MTSVTATVPTASVPGSRRARTLGEAFSIFARHLSPVLIMLTTVGVVAARVAVADWRWGQLLIVAIVVALQPFIEWTTHVFVLHARPRRLLGRELDLYVAKKHRRHHADPRNLDILSMPVPGLITIAAITSGVAALLGSWGDRLTLGVTVAVLVLVYEWVHFLIHTDVPAKHAPYKQLHRAHRLHHYRNENYWLGVTNHLGDRVLRTDPATEDVPVSATAVTALAGLTR